MNSSCHPLLAGADGQSAREVAAILDSPFIEQANFPFVKFCPRGLLSPAEPRIQPRTLRRTVRGAFGRWFSEAGCDGGMVVCDPRGRCCSRLERDRRRGEG